MDYSDVNRKHWRIISCLAVQNDGGARFVLRCGRVVEARTPQEAERKLAEEEDLWQGRS